MKLVVYGVSRSGKDFLIDKACSYLAEQGISLKHIKGSIELNRISLNIYGKSFNRVNDDKKELIRKKFISELKVLEQQYINIIVDGHYAFYDDQKNIYNVITSEDLNCYDTFLYLNTPSEVIMKRMDIDGVKTSFKNYSITLINEWKTYEIENLTNDLLLINKELHIIQNDECLTYQYIEEIVNGKHDSKKIAQEIVNNILRASDSKVYILTDCDKTLSKEDSTSLAFACNSLENEVLKNIYKGDFYTNYQAYLAYNYCTNNYAFDNSSIQYAIERLSANVELVDDLKQLKMPIIALSGGNEKIWNGFFNKYDVDIDFYNNGMIMSKYIKYYVVKYLEDNGKFVISLGDSIMDCLMLNVSTKGYLVNTKGYRNNLKLALQTNVNIYQLAYNCYIYDSNPVDERIILTKTLNNSEDQIKEIIDLSKSSSGTDGMILRDAHRKAGNYLADLISKQNISKMFAVIIMMRSGLLIGEGIADTLDCPILFYDEFSSNKFITEWNYLNRNNEYTAIICDGVINSGKSILTFLDVVGIDKFIIATNVISSKCSLLNSYPIYATRISNNSFIGTKQKEILNGKGPDTSDRLFKTL